MSLASTPFAGAFSSVPSGSFMLVISPSADQAVLAAATTGAVTAGVPGPLSERNNTQARMSAPRMASGTSQREPLAAAESTPELAILVSPLLNGKKGPRILATDLLQLPYSWRGGHAPAPRAS